MKEKFISLTLKENDKKCLISSVMIASIVEEDQFRRCIRTMGGGLYHVKETTEEILDLINKSELYTFVNK